MGRAGFGDRVEGFHAVTAAATAGRVEVLHVERGRLARPEVGFLVDSVRRSGAAVHLVEDVRTRAVTTAPQGLVAECAPRPVASLEAVVATSDPAAVLVVDRVVDPHNLGAIVRSAVAAGTTGLVVSDRRAAPLGAAAFKAAAGALEHATVAVVGSVGEAVTRLKKLGLWAVGLDAGADRALFGLDLLTEPVAIVIGGEGGLSRLVAERLDVTVSVPMVGPTESLNASVAAALACYELHRIRFYQ